MASTELVRLGEGLRSVTAVYKSGTVKYGFARVGLMGAAVLVFAQWSVAEYNPMTHRDRDGQDWLALDLGYHCRWPFAPSLRAMGECSWLDGAPCFYRGSSYLAEKALAFWLEKDRTDSAIDQILHYEYHRLS